MGAGVRHIDLFAGIGGFSRAVEWLGGETVAFVEWDAWNRRVLAKHWPEAHYHGDIKTLTADVIRGWGIRTSGVSMAHSESLDDREQPDNGLTIASGRHARLERGGGNHGCREPFAGTQVDLITGGYPCQPFSLAGQRLGAEDDRALWPEMRRVIDLCRPRFVLAENVSGHVTMGLDTVLSDLEGLGYTCGAVVVPACAVNALHRRDRVWIMAHAESERHERSGEARGWWTGPADSGIREAVADTGRGDGDGWPRTAGGNDADGPDAGRSQGAGGTDQRGEGMGDAKGDAGASARPEGCQAGAGSPPRDSGESRGVNARQAPRPLDIGASRVPTGLVRRPATRSPEPDLIRAAWADGSWEWDLPRVVSEEPERRQKLQAAGNAIVPLVAYEILSVMLSDAA